MKPIELTSESFDSTIQNTTTPVLVDFHAEWCGPCKMMSPVLDQLADELGDEAVIAKVDIDAARDIAARFQVTSIPTLIVFRNGEAITGAKGMQTKTALKQLIETAAASTGA